MRSKTIDIEAAFDLVAEIFRRQGFENLRHDSERQQVAQTMVEFHKSLRRSRHQCMAPGCTRESVTRSHIFGRRGPMATVAENGRVITPVSIPLKGRVALRSQSVASALAFPGFCTDHENAFKPVDGPTFPIELGDLYLQFLRIAANELRSTELILQSNLNAQALIHAYQERILLDLLNAVLGEQAVLRKVKHLSITSGGDIKTLLAHHQRVIERSLERLQRVIFTPLSDPSHWQDELCSVVYCLSTQVPVCLGGVSGFRYRLPGDSELRDPLFILVVWPTRTNTYIAMAGPRRDQQLMMAYLQSFFAQPLGALSMIETWMIHASDQWCLQPSTWHSLPPWRRANLQMHHMDDQRGMLQEYEFSIFDNIRYDWLHENKRLPAIYSPSYVGQPSFEFAKLAKTGAPARHPIGRFGVNIKRDGY